MDPHQMIILMKMKDTAWNIVFRTAPFLGKQLKKPHLLLPLFILRLTI